MANYSSILAWEIPWTEEPGGLQRVKCDWVTEDEHTWICWSKEALLQAELGQGILSGELCSRCLLPSSLEQLASLDCPYSNV